MTPFDCVSIPFKQPMLLDEQDTNVTMLTRYLVNELEPDSAVILV